MHTPELDFVTVFNAVEAVWWFSCCGLMWRHGVRHPRHRTLALRTAFALGLFGASDVVELFTGAWWRPWWLAVIKVLCATVITIGTWILWRRGGFVIAKPSRDGV